LLYKSVQKRTSKKFPYFVSSERPRRRIPSAQSLKDGVVIFQQVGALLSNSVSGRSRAYDGISAALHPME
ncbi:MAG: hypothetical protein KA376_05025, partial [Alistipes sp.]|nr:hypothetical protein [Alistipes sp.]